jgi:hypothetical protein
MVRSGIWLRGEPTVGNAATGQHHADAKLIWDYHQLRPCSAGIGLGSHDLGVATLAADLYRAGLFPVLVFSGGNSPTTAARFPRGEAVHLAEHAMQRRAYATIRKAWPEVEPKCASEDISFDEYLKSIGDDRLVIDMLVGDLQRIIEYPHAGSLLPRTSRPTSRRAYQRLTADGYDSRLMKE